MSPCVLISSFAPFVQHCSKCCFDLLAEMYGFVVPPKNWLLLGVFENFQSTGAPSRRSLQQNSPGSFMQTHSAIEFAERL
jgi:hypothetical protein